MGFESNGGECVFANQIGKYTVMEGRIALIPQVRLGDFYIAPWKTDSYLRVGLPLFARSERPSESAAVLHRNTHSIQAQY
jgi:hypothetical protein